MHFQKTHHYGRTILRNLLSATLAGSLVITLSTAQAAHSSTHRPAKSPLSAVRARLQAALQQQHVALLEVKMQKRLTAKAQHAALQQQKMALRHGQYERLASLPMRSPGNAVMAAYSLRGSRYVMGGTSRSGFDCSGFVRYVLSTADGVAVPRTAAEQYYHGKPIPVQNMEPGDLVFFKNTYKRGISHVGIYAGQGKFIHAANSHKGVRVDILNSAYYWHHFAGARRVLPAQMRQAAFLR